MFVTVDYYCCVFVGQNIPSIQRKKKIALNGQDIPFVNSIKYLGVIFDKKITWRLHIETIKAKDFRTFIRIYLPPPQKKKPLLILQ
jgi:hypothetical protein